MQNDEELTPQAAAEAVSLFEQQLDDPPEWEWLTALWAWFRQIWDKLMNLAAEAADWVWSRLSSWFTDIWDRIVFLVTSIPQFFVQTWERVTDIVSGWVDTLWSWIQGLWGTMGEWFSSLGMTMAQFFVRTWEQITDMFGSLGETIATYFAGMPGIITETLVDPITDWLSGFMEYIGTTLRMLGESLLRGIFGLPLLTLETFGEDIINGFKGFFAWVGRWAEAASANIIEAILGYVQRVGRIDPTNAPTVAGGLMSLVGTGVFALSAMTLAGELMHPLKEIGMGHVSAMIGDVINYRVISGAFMAALVGAALGTPLRYYFNYVLRPWLPDRRVMDMSMSRELFSQPETLVAPEWVEPIKALVGKDAREFERRMLGYHGFHDEWFPVYKELANTPVGYFALAGIARTGVFEPSFFTEAIQRAGYSPRLKREFYKMFEYMAKASAQTLYIGDPINAFKEGWYNEDRLERELLECGVPAESLPRYVHAAWIKYEVDLLSDRLAGLKDAYRKGLVIDAEFTRSLTGWGMVEERAAEHLHREQIRRYGKTSD